MKVRILFVKPPTRHFSSATGVPMGILYVSSYAKKWFGDRIDTKLVDMRISAINDFKYLKNYVNTYKPHIVGLSCCTDDDYYMRIIARMVKEVDKNILVVVGGPHPTMYTQEVLKEKNIDFAVIGEGEQTFVELLEFYFGKKSIEDIDGLAFRRDGEIKINPSRKFIENLDELPFPDWDILEFDRYSDVRYLSMNVLLAGKRYMGIVTSRGCPYRCVYCHNMFGKKYRKRSSKNVVEEIKILVDKYKVDELHIYDDIFNLDKKRVEEICNLMIELGIRIKFCFPNGIRGDILDKKLILKLKKAGAYMLTFALETASSRLQKLIKKNIIIERLKENIIFADKAGFITKCYTMIGFPTESLEEIKHTIDFTCSLPLCFASFFIVTVQKSTELYTLVKNIYEDFNLSFEENQYYLKHTKYEQLTRLPLKKLQIKAYRKFYLSVKRIIKIISRMPRKIFAVVNLHKYFMFYFLGKTVIRKKETL